MLYVDVSLQNNLHPLVEGPYTVFWIHMICVLSSRGFHDINWHTARTEVPPDIVRSLVPIEDAVHHSSPSQSLPLLFPSVFGRPRVVVNESLGTHKSFTSSPVETWTHNVLVPNLQ